MTEANKPPRFFSLAFHTSFFPDLLWRLLRPKNRKYESTFAGHIRLELPVLTVVFIMLGFFGFAAGLGSGSIIGWICGILGGGGVLYLLTDSIRSVWGVRPSYDYFRTIIFIFMVVLGFTAGLAIGTDRHFSYGVKIIMGLVGVIPAYAAGIFCGFWAQRLGWMASLLDVIAVAGIAGMLVLDVILLL